MTCSQCSVAPAPWEKGDGRGNVKLLVGLEAYAGMADGMFSKFFLFLSNVLVKSSLEGFGKGWQNLEGD